MTLVRTLLLFGMLSAACESKALPPRQHPAVGVIESIDHVAQFIFLVEPVTKARRAFFWTNTTRLRCDGKRSQIGTLQPGMSVKCYYRNWSGRSVLRELRWTKLTAERIRMPHPVQSSEHLSAGSSIAGMRKGLAAVLA